MPCLAENRVNGKILCFTEYQAIRTISAIRRISVPPTFTLMTLVQVTPALLQGTLHHLDPMIVAFIPGIRRISVPPTFTLMTLVQVTPALLQGTLHHLDPL